MGEQIRPAWTLAPRFQVKGRLCLRFSGASESLGDGGACALAAGRAAKGAAGGQDGGPVSGFPLPRFLLLCGHPSLDTGRESTVPTATQLPLRAHRSEDPVGCPSCWECPCSQATRKEETGVSAHGLWNKLL